MASEHLGEQIRKQSFLRSPLFWVGVLPIVGLVITAVGLGIDIVGPKQPEPELTFEIVSDTDVLDVHRPLQDLSVSFRGEDVQERNLNLRILTINILNSGEADILLNHYDSEVNWGLRVNGADVVEARLIDASSKYLESRISPNVIDSETVAFPRVIFEANAFFAIEVLLLHSEEQEVFISQVGKIAGVDEAKILVKPPVEEEADFGTLAFRGGALVQIVRTFTYSIGLFLVIMISMIMLGVSILVATLVIEHRRRNEALKTRTIQDMDKNRVRNFLIKQYKSGGKRRLELLQRTGKEPALVNWTMPAGRWVFKDEEEERNILIVRHYDGSERASFASEEILEELKEMGILTRGERDAAIIDPLFTQMVDELLAELR